MLFNLVKKDFILVKKYLIFMLVFSIVAPIFIYSKFDVSNGSSISFFITVFYVEFILFSSVSMIETKYKGAALLCTTPYTRSGVVKAKYLFILVIFLGCYLLYQLAVLFGASRGLTTLSIFSTGISLLIITVLFGILIPVQIKLGYIKTKNISMFIVFITPFVLPHLMKNIPIHQLTNFKLSSSIEEWIPFILACLVFLVSMQISQNLYNGKDL
ncbi:ABC-2 transporter permease [Niallia sp. 01092]|uniref:ABC-2 transporter permease n=1 Tax=unclassified Niallia TaxID=2837522 RepID=UPI003FD14B20